MPHRLPGNAFFLLGDQPGFVSGLVALREVLIMALSLTAVVLLRARMVPVPRPARYTLTPALGFAIARRPQMVDTGMSHIGFRCVLPDARLVG